VFGSPRLVGCRLSEKLGSVAVEWAKWCNVYANTWIKSSVLKYPSVCLEIRAFLHALFSYCSPVPTLSYAAKTISPTPSKVLWTNDRSDIQPQTSKHNWSHSSKFVLPNAHTLKIWLKTLQRFQVKNRNLQWSESWMPLLMFFRLYRKKLDCKWEMQRDITNVTQLE